MPSPFDPIDVLRLSDIGDIVATIPHLLGFQPAESLVAVALTGARERITFSLRLDLVEEEHDAAVACDVACRMQLAEAEAVFLFVFTASGPAGGELPRRPLIDALQQALPVPVRDAVLVTSERLWSYVCDDPGCCPPEGRLRDPESPGTVAVAAAHALHGDAVLPSRDAVVASVAPLGGIAAVSMRDALQRAGSQRLSVGPDRFGTDAVGLLADALRRYADPPATLSHDEAATLVLGLHSTWLRDDLLMRCTGDDDAVRGLLRDLARHALPPFDAPVCTVLACSAYLHGDGVVAASALDRALASDADYSLARLVRVALDGQLTPAALRAALAGRPAPRGRRRRPAS